MLQRIIKKIQLPLSLVLVLLTLNQQPVQAMQQQAALPALKEEFVIKGTQSSYVVGKELGRGKFGVVSKGTRAFDQMPVAIKYCLDGSSQLLEDECLCQQMCDHFGIVRFLELIRFKGGSYAIVMEFAEGESIREVTKKKILCNYEVGLFIAQVVLALYHMHEKKVIHCDIKSENIIFNSDAIMKICDFGLAERGGKSFVRTGTPYYLAPEVVEKQTDETYYTSARDMWALGIILGRIVTKGHYLFNDRSIPFLFRNILANDRNKKAQQALNKCSLEIVGLVNSLLNQDPAQRPTAKDLLSNQYVHKCLCFFVWYVLHCPKMVVEKKIDIVLQIIEQLCPQQVELPYGWECMEPQDRLLWFAQCIVRLLGYQSQILGLSAKPVDMFDSLDRYRVA